VKFPSRRGLFSPPRAAPEPGEITEMSVEAPLVASPAGGDQTVFPASAYPGARDNEMGPPAPDAEELMLRRQRLDTIDPRRMLWAGVISDISNYVASPFRYQMQGLGNKYYLQAQQYNAGVSDFNTRLSQEINNNRLRKEQIRLASAAVPNEYAQFPEAYQTWMLSGAKDRGVTFEEFIRQGTGVNQGPAAVQNWQFRQSLSPEERAVFDRGAGFAPNEESRSMLMKDYQYAVGQGYEGSLVDFQRDFAGSRAFGSATGKGAGERDSSFVAQVQDTLPVMYQQVNEIKMLREAIKSGKLTKTGPLEQYYRKWSDPETARAAVMQIATLLQNLNITKLTPVSNFEIELVNKMYFDIGNDPAANIGALAAAEDILARKIALVEAKKGYYAKNGSLQGFENAFKRSDRPEGFEMQQPDDDDVTDADIERYLNEPLGGAQ
jgi:hypothetical protein